MPCPQFFTDARVLAVSPVRFVVLVP